MEVLIKLIDLLDTLVVHANEKYGLYMPELRYDLKQLRDEAEANLRRE